MDAAKGYVIWTQTEDWNGIEELRFIHQGVCDPRTRVVNGKVRFGLSMSLNDYLFNLLHNLRYKPEVAKKEVHALREYIGAALVERVEII
jgi:hypothetical protein